MIQEQTLLKVADNSGAKIAKCIKVIGGFKKKFAGLGDIVIVSIQELRNKSKMSSKVLKGEIYKAIIIRKKKRKKKKDGSNFFFATNSISLINKQNKFIATRILGPIPKQLRASKYIKLATISSGFF